MFQVIYSSFFLNISYNIHRFESMAKDSECFGYYIENFLIFFNK